MIVTEPSFLPSTNPRVKAADFPFRQKLPVQMRFTDIDMLGHLNNNVYLTFLDLAKIEYFSDAIGEFIDMHTIDMVVAHIDIDFLSATFFGENIEVWTRTIHIGVKSLQLEQRVVEANTGETKAVCTTVMVGYDPSLNKSLPIEPRWHAALSDFEHRQF